MPAFLVHQPRDQCGQLRIIGGLLAWHSTSRPCIERSLCNGCRYDGRSRGCCLGAGRSLDSDRRIAANLRSGKLRRKIAGLLCHGLLGAHVEQRRPTAPIIDLAPVQQFQRRELLPLQLFAHQPQRARVEPLARILGIGPGFLLQHHLHGGNLGLGATLVSHRVAVLVGQRAGRGATLCKQGQGLANCPVIRLRLLPASLMPGFGRSQATVLDLLVFAGDDRPQQPAGVFLAQPLMDHGVNHPAAFSTQDCGNPPANQGVRSAQAQLQDAAAQFCRQPFAPSINGTAPERVDLNRHRLPPLEEPISPASGITSLGQMYDPHMQRSTQGAFIQTKPIC